MSRRWRRERGPARSGPAPVVELVEADPAWKRIAWEELSEVWQLLQPWCGAGVHHVGSTAVPGVPARPVIDLWAGLADAARAPDAGAALEAAGWRRAPVPAGAAGDELALAAGPTYERTRDDGTAVAVELQPAGSARWNAAMLLRDRLRAEERTRNEYARIKRRAAERADSRADYERRKAAFIHRAIGA